MTRQPITHTIRDGFCTVCDETEEWIKDNGWPFIMADQADTTPATKTADELVPGDVFHYDTMNTWKILERVSETAKMVTYRFEYVSTTYETSRIGTSKLKAFRKATRFTMA